MTGLLAADGIRVCQLRVGNSLQRADPASHHKRYTTTYRLTNPIPYQSSYFVFVQLTDKVGKLFHL